MENSAEKYGLTPQEARKVGLMDESDRLVNRDIELEGAILRHLRSMGAEHVHVNVKFGKVFLNGFCDDFSLKRAVHTFVRSMTGEGRVVNHVKVFPADTSRPGRG